ncbi:mitochondrial fission factor-like isoform X2 [Myripristis murdjan]|uniref:mitochondrial fission factor-like isoform X2 n=1 Tax=Myripristis murdjan TaxID=586833 RepID=UPI0011762CA2|nr:mitochondrial fission factor-like isoform X2 [Myripristis murdjan]
MMASFAPYPREMSQGPGQDPVFMEAISNNMRIPERLSVGPGRQWAGQEEEDELPPAYSMHVPDRLTYTAPDMNPRPLFTPSRPSGHAPLVLDPNLDDVFYREPLHVAGCTIRRSYSDQSFGRSPPGTPTHPKQVLALHSHPSSSRGSGRPPRQRSFVAPSPVGTADPRPRAEAVALPLGLPALPPGLLSPQSLLEAAKQLGLQASQRLLQTVSHKYSLNNNEKPQAVTPVAEAPDPAPVEQSRKSMMETWSVEEEGGAVVELMVLRRQVLKMSRRLAGLERQNAERKNTEVVLFSLLLSACLLNAWLWIRR